MNPNEFMDKLQIQHSDLDQQRGGYIISRKQHMAMLYKAGIKKSDQELSETEEDFLNRMDTSTLIQEIERRTRG